MITRVYNISWSVEVCLRVDATAHALSHRPQWWESYKYCKRNFSGAFTSTNILVLLYPIVRWETWDFLSHVSILYKARAQTCWLTQISFCKDVFRYTLNRINGTSANKAFFLSDILTLDYYCALHNILCKNSPLLVCPRIIFPYVTSVIWILKSFLRSFLKLDQNS